MAVDYYAVLGVPERATQQELRTAYLALARKNHPDRFSGAAQKTAQAKMQSINEAWSILGVAHERKAYDSKREQQGTGPAPGASHAQGPRRGRAHFAAFDTDDDPIDRSDVDLDPTPLSGSRPLPDWLRMAPVLLVVAALFVFGFGVFVGASGIVALGAMMFAIGFVGFLILPLLVMSRAAKDDKQ